MFLDLDERGTAHLVMALRLYERRLRTDGYHQLPPLLRQLHDALVARTGQERTTSDGDDQPGEDGRVLLLDYDDVAAQLGVSERTVRRLVETGDLRVVRIGQSPRVHPDDLRAFVESLRQQRSA